MVHLIMTSTSSSRSCSSACSGSGVGLARATGRGRARGRGTLRSAASSSPRHAPRGEGGKGEAVRGDAGSRHAAGRTRARAAAARGAVGAMRGSAPLQRPPGGRFPRPSSPRCSPAKVRRCERRLRHRSRAYWPPCGVGAAAILTLLRTRCCAASFSTRCCAFTEPVSQPQIWASRSFAVRWCLATTVGAATQARRSTRHRTMPHLRASAVLAPAKPTRRGRGGKLSGRTFFCLCSSAGLQTGDQKLAPQEEKNDR